MAAPRRVRCKPSARCPFGLGASEQTRARLDEAVPEQVTVIKRRVIRQAIDPVRQEANLQMPEGAEKSGSSGARRPAELSLGGGSIEDFRLGVTGSRRRGDIRVFVLN